MKPLQGTLVVVLDCKFGISCTKFSCVTRKQSGLVEVSFVSLPNILLLSPNSASREKKYFSF